MNVRDNYLDEAFERQRRQGGIFGITQSDSLSWRADRFAPSGQERSRPGLTGRLKLIQEIEDLLDYAAADAAFEEPGASFSWGEVKKDFGIK